MRIRKCVKIENLSCVECRVFEFPDGNPEEWRGITVFAEVLPDRSPDPAALDLLTKAREFAEKTGDKAQLLMIGEGLVEIARAYFSCGADRVFVYDDPSLQKYDEDRYASVLMHFIDNFKPAELNFVQTPRGERLSARVIEGLSAILPFAGESFVTENCTAIAESDTSRRGELVICEIP